MIVLSPLNRELADEIRQFRTRCCADLNPHSRGFYQTLTHRLRKSRPTLAMELDRLDLEEVCAVVAHVVQP